MLLLADAVEQLFNGPTPVFAMGTVVAIVAIVAGAVRRIVVSRSQERTRREIAAYVAEGTMDPDKAVEILKAGKSSGICS